MTFHVKRSKTSDIEVLTQYNGIRSTRWVQPPSGLSVLEIQTTHTPTALQKVPDDKNYLTPPYHCPSTFSEMLPQETNKLLGHWYQDEYFHIKEGCVKMTVIYDCTECFALTLYSRYVFTLEGKEMRVSATDPQPVHIPATARHTFKVDDTHEGPCTVEISTKVSPYASPGSPEATGASAQLYVRAHACSDKMVLKLRSSFRNIYTYLDDCYIQGVSPSLPQLLLMLDNAEMSLAFPWGPDWLMRGVSYSMGVVVGRWFGGYVLGYKASYPEYWSEPETKKYR